MDQLSDELKMATRMGIRAGIEMVINSLQATADDPRSAHVAPIKAILEAAIKVARERMERQFPEVRT